MNSASTNGTESERNLVLLLFFLFLHLALLSLLMPFRKLPHNIRDLAADYYNDDRLSLRGVVKRLNGKISKTEVSRVAALKRLTGSASADPTLYGPRGRPRKIKPSHNSVLTRTLTLLPTTSGSSLSIELLLQKGIFVSSRTVTRHLKRIDYTFKKVESRACEADAAEEALFLLEADDQGSEEFLFLDEVRINERTSNFLFGWGRKGKRVIVRQPLNRGRSWSAIPVLTTSGRLSTAVIEGNYNEEAILEMLEKHVVRSFPFFLLPSFRHLFSPHSSPTPTVQTASIRLSSGTTPASTRRLPFSKRLRLMVRSLLFFFSSFYDCTDIFLSPSCRSQDPQHPAVLAVAATE
jgi:transposase